MKRGAAYRDASQMQAALVQKIGDSATSGLEAARSVRAWIQLERFKREMRGIPALAPHSLQEIAGAKRDLQRAVKDRYGEEVTCFELPPPVSEG